MLKGIYFLETNSGILSDMEGCFTINDAFLYKGGCGVIREAVKQLNQMDGVDFVVISERLIDGDCEEALRQLENIPAQKIVATSTKDEILKMKLAKKARLLPFPYTYDELDELLKKSTLLKDFKAVKEGNVWCLTKSMFQETTCLGDVIMDIHRMLTEDDPEGLTYLYRLE